MNNTSNESTTVSTRQICAELGVARSTIWLKTNPKSKYFEPDFPKAFKLSDGARKKYYRRADVEAYVAKRAAKGV